MNYFFCDQTVNYKNTKDYEPFILLYPPSLTGQWLDLIVGVGFGWLSNSSTASCEGRPELCSSAFGTFISGFHENYRYIPLQYCIPLGDVTGLLAETTSSHHTRPNNAVKIS